jgi:proline iminopeptidase
VRGGSVIRFRLCRAARLGHLVADYAEAMFAPLEPYADGMLATTDGNEIYWEISGNPNGIPAVTLHGGPGSGLTSGYRRRFDPERYLIVGLDQRGCGRSRPLVTDPGVDLSTNTTDALIDDLERLRLHLGIQRWLVSGLSWGSTLAIAYAEAHPQRTLALALLAVTNTSTDEVEWITEGIGRVFPREWDEFAGASGRRHGQRVIDAYHERITDPDPGIRRAAALAWCRWEDVHPSLDPAYRPMSRYEDPVFREVFATLVIHYWKHSGFGGDELLARIDRIADIPAVLVHGRLDVSGPLVTAWRLHRAWRASELVVVENEGHGGEAMVTALVEAIDRLGRHG